MEKNNGNKKGTNRFKHTPEEQERYMRELSAIYYRCLMGKGSPQDQRIAEKFSPALIEKLKNRLLPKEKRTPQSEHEKEAEEAEMQQMWERVTEKLNLSQPLLPAEEHQFTEADYQKAYELESRSRKKRSPMRIVYHYAAVAAMVAIVVGTGHFFNNKSSNHNVEKNLANETIAYGSTGSSQLKRINLPDGTQVELNRESSLKLSKAFGKSKREVSMSGQIFFDVSKDASRPFVIDASGINVTVRGTAFEVMSYDEIPERAVTVCHGKVEVRNSRTGELLTTLTKGMQLIFNPENNKAEINTVDAESVMAWREGRLILHNASLPELRLRLRQYFGKNLVIENHALKEDLRFSSSFNYEEVTLDNVMMRLCTLFGVKSRIDGNRVIVSPVNNI